MARTRRDQPREGFILALDQGTDFTTAVLMDAMTREVAAVGSHPITTTYPAPGCVEHDAENIWDSTVEAIQQCLSRAPGITPLALAVSTQRENAVMWSRSTGAPLGPVLGWADARTAPMCEIWGETWSERVHQDTGLALNPLYSGPKLRWLLDEARDHGVDISDICLGTIDSWLLWNLTGEFLTEPGNASRTLLFSLADMDWSPALLDIFGIPRGSLARVVGSNAGFGTTKELGRLPAGVPVAAVMADSHASLYYHGCMKAGTGKVTYKSGCSVMTPSDTPRVHFDGITTTVAWSTDAPTYAREGNTVSSGSALDWAARFVGRTSASSSEQFLSRLAADVPNSGGVVFVPAFAGLGAPYWDRDATSVITGVSPSTTRAHLARAALEAIAHQVADVVETIEEDGRAPISVLEVDGEWTQSALLMQIQADLLGKPLRIANDEHASALGVAVMAALSLGFRHEHTDPRDDGDTRVVMPSGTLRNRVASRAEWRRAVARSRGQGLTEVGVAALR
jgi:glycerol kinase